jgi:hypothetical protein
MWAAIRFEVSGLHLFLGGHDSYGRGRVGLRAFALNTPFISAVLLNLHNDAFRVGPDIGGNNRGEEQNDANGNNIRKQAG